MNKLQADEKTVIQTALELIRANDRNPSAQPSDTAARSQNSTIAVKPFPSRNPESSQVAVKPFPSPGSESPQNQIPELPPDLQAVIQTALQNGFPGQVNLPPNQPLQPPNSPAANPPISANSDRANPDPLEELEAQANRMNQLSRSREAALRRAQSIATQIQQERRTARRQVELSLPLEPSLSRPQTQRPHPSNPLSNPRSPVSPESVTLRIQVPPETQETATEVAQLLRQLQGHRNVRDDASLHNVPVQRSRRRPSLLRRLRRWLFANPSDRSLSHQRQLNRPDPSLQSYSPEAIASPEPVFTLQETLTLLVGAAITRLLLNLLLESLPLLTIPVMILLMLPAAIALYQATTAPQFSILWGYRICIILLGLLIGGRL